MNRRDGGPLSRLGAGGYDAMPYGDTDHLELDHPATLAKWLAECQMRKMLDNWVAANFKPGPEPIRPVTSSIYPDELGDLPASLPVFPLYLWLVERPCPGGANTTVGVVVVAANETAARGYFPGNYGETDLNRAELVVTCAGIALPGAVPGARVCTDFNAA